VSAVVEDCAEAFLRLAAPEHQETARDWLRRGDRPDGWAHLQQAFLDMVDRYVAAEMARPADHIISCHEAGGNWRIAFPHLAVRYEPGVVEHLGKVLAARRAFTDADYFHGYHDKHEVHHEIETFLYFQIPLLYLEADSSAAALASIEDVAEHVGNWVEGVPPWYDWQTHGFRSTWLGTRVVRDYPPHDYQEANHFRIVDLCIAAYAAARKERYLSLAVDYAGRWCEHIETHHAAGQVIPCHILPAGAARTEMGRAGANRDETRYQVFYSVAALNTAFDILGALMDLYRLTGTERYLRCYRLLLDQFFAHGQGGRPAMAHEGGEWMVRRDRGPFGPGSAIGQWAAFPARLALKHDVVTGEERYRRAVLDWARAVDEHREWADQCMTDVMIAAHYYTGDPAWLRRACEMALRTWAVCEDNMGDRDGLATNCSAVTRYGSKFMMEQLYQPLLGGCDWGTRGSMPVRVLAHRVGEATGLPHDAGFRLWRRGPGAHAFEAVNTGGSPVSWSLGSADPDRPFARVELQAEGAWRTAIGGRITLAAGQRAVGRIVTS